MCTRWWWMRWGCVAHYPINYITRHKGAAARPLLLLLSMTQLTIPTLCCLLQQMDPLPHTVIHGNAGKGFVDVLASMSQVGPVGAGPAGDLDGPAPVYLALVDLDAGEEWVELVRGAVWCCVMLCDAARSHWMLRMLAHALRRMVRVREFFAPRTVCDCWQTKLGAMQV